MINFICFSSREYYPKFLVLYKSIRKFYPDNPIHLFGLNNLDKGPDDVIFTKLNTNNISRERPLQILKLFNEGIEEIVHLGSDCELFDRMVYIDNRLRTYDIILTPHITQPLPFDDKAPSNGSIVLTGHINGDFLAIRKSDNSIKMMQWLADTLKDNCKDDKHNGIFFDQTWLTYLQYFFPYVKILKDNRYNVAYWNVNQREFNFKDDVYQTSDGPLVFFHYSGFDEKHPEKMSKHQNRYTAEGDILKIYQEYAEKLKG